METKSVPTKDLSDEGQTIWFPDLKTQAQNEQTGNQLASPSEKVTITDTVSSCQSDSRQKNTP
ncbi:MAG: VaFE repeat-containing surface-anchored protein [Ruminococcus sp.]